jgi:hypothetical protein
VPLPISCPRCGVTREVKDKYIGLKVQCKNCGEFVRVAQFEVIEEVEIIDEPVVELPPAREIHQRRGRVSKSRDGMHLGVVVSLFAVGIIVITTLSIGLVSLTNPFALASSRYAQPIPTSPMTSASPPPSLPDVPKSRVLPHSSPELIVSAHRPPRKGRDRGLEVHFTFLGPTIPADNYYEIVVNVGNGKQVKTYPLPKGQRHGDVAIDGIGGGGPGSGERIEIWVAKKSSPNDSGDGECVSNRTFTY